jgi:hypothetical protein
MSKTVAYVPDLMDRSKVAAYGPVTFVSRPADLPGASEGATLVVVDLSRAGVLEVLGAIDAPTIGFGRHDDRERLAAAITAGCDRVLARSAFFSQVSQLLGTASEMEGLGQDEGQVVVEATTNVGQEALDEAFEGGVESRPRQ